MNMEERKTYLARKRQGYLIEPITDGPRRRWEGHHATNPTAIRLSGDSRVFLGYRAGGDGDAYALESRRVWGSHLGLAVLDSHGERVLHRFPLPIFTIEPTVGLPQSADEFQAYQSGPHRDEIVVLHDFRFWEDGGWLYLIYHEGTLTRAYDCVVRMKVGRFLDAVEQSIGLVDDAEPATEGELDRLRPAWRKLWWQPGTWEPCGVDGTNRIYPSDTSKNDIVFLRLDDGSVAMYHRPVPDIAFAITAGGPFLTATADGITRAGTLQTCIRPGLTDNSHVGNNGVPVKAKLDGKEVAIDVAHGVYNEAVSDEKVTQRWKLTYYPYLRILDTQTGECLYYSEKPLLEYGGVWDEYTRKGKWVASLDHLDGVMFAGGQVAVQQGHNGLDDTFRVYVGVGDTAVAVADFRLADVLPARVVEDIRDRDRHEAALAEPVSENRYDLPRECSGWRWAIGNDPAHRKLFITRTLEALDESERRPVNTRPGFFDADSLYFDGTSVVWDEALGWIVYYVGARWSGSGENRRTDYGVGVLLLDRENPERVLHRSDRPLPGTEGTMNGWSRGDLRYRIYHQHDHVPDSVRREVIRLYTLDPMPSDMTKWLRIKSDRTKRSVG